MTYKRSHYTDALHASSNLNFYTTNDGQARNKLSGRNTAHSGRSESSLRVNGDCQEELTKKLSPPLMKHCENIVLYIAGMCANRCSYKTTDIGWTKKSDECNHT